MTTDRNVEAMAVSVKISEVVGAIQRQASRTIEATRVIYDSLRQYPAENIGQLDVKGLPYVVLDPRLAGSPSAVKQRTLVWLLKSAFQECIAGINASLIEAYRFAKLRSVHLRTRGTENPPTYEELQKELMHIQTKPEDLFVPTLIASIKSELNTTIDFEEEIQSINHVRNCFVHRGGEVGRADLKGPDGVLKLHYQELLINVVTQDGTHLPIDRDLKAQGTPVSPVSMEYRRVTKSFTLGEQVTLSEDDLNSVLVTCNLFGQHLLAKLIAFAPEIDSATLNNLIPFLANQIVLSGKSATAAEPSPTTPPHAV